MCFHDAQTSCTSWTPPITAILVSALGDLGMSGRRVGDDDVFSTLGAARGAFPCLPGVTRRRVFPVARRSGACCRRDLPCRF
jgi:hypothetical protein